MFVSSISIENLRCYEQAGVTFEHPDAASTSNAKRVENVTLLLGDNGAGKTTILKAVALAVLAPVIQDSGYRPYYLIRRTVEPFSARVSRTESSLVLHGQDCDPKDDFTEKAGFARPFAGIAMMGDYETLMAGYSSGDQFSDDEHPFARLYEDDSPAYFLVGYGATRRVASPNGSEVFSEKSRGLRYQRVASLFEDHVPLRSLKLWLPGLDSSRREAVIDLLNDLLPDDIRFGGDFDDLQPVFTHRGVDLPFTALSDGYRGYIGMVADLLFHLNHICPQDRKLNEMTGVVLIDDIDLHLHPSWQRTVVTKLAATLPRLQFIVTSHSPLVAATLYAQNIRIINSPPDGPSHVAKLDERIHGLNADQVLTSSYFGMPSSRARPIRCRSSPKWPTRSPAAARRRRRLPSSKSSPAKTLSE